MSKPELPGFGAGCPSPFRMPFYHTRFYWQEALQGLFDRLLRPAWPSAADEMRFFGLAFARVRAVSDDPFAIIASAIIVFVNLYAPGWIHGGRCPWFWHNVLLWLYISASHLQAMTALFAQFRSAAVIPAFPVGQEIRASGCQITLKAGIILAANRRAQNRVCLTSRNVILLQQPIAHHTACCPVPDRRASRCRLANTP